MTREEYQAAGGGAFPISAEEFFDRGMSLRDYFAGQALVGILAAQADPNMEVLLGAKEAAKESYEYADAMLAVRKAAVKKVSEQERDGDEKHFREWMEGVDRELVRMCGIDSGSLPDVDYRSMFDEETDPTEAAKYVIEYAKEN